MYYQTIYCNSCWNRCTGTVVLTCSNKEYKKSGVEYKHMQHRRYHLNNERQNVNSSRIYRKYDTDAAVDIVPLFLFNAYYVAFSQVIQKKWINYTDHKLIITAMLSTLSWLHIIRKYHYKP